MATLLIYGVKFAQTETRLYKYALFFRAIWMFCKTGRTRRKENCREGEIISKTDLREVQNHQAQRQYQSNL